jgi:hypothetical protein
MQSVHAIIGRERSDVLRRGSCMMDECIVDTKSSDVIFFFYACFIAGMLYLREVAFLVPVTLVAVRYQEYITKIGVLMRNIIVFRRNRQNSMRTSRTG